MISAGDFRNGVTFEMNDGSIVQIIEFQHVKPGKGRGLCPRKDTQRNHRGCDGNDL